MASVLASQLAQVAANRPQEHWVRGKASLIFSYQQAADVGADTLLSIAQTGAWGWLGSANGLACIKECLRVAARPINVVAARIRLVSICARHYCCSLLTLFRSSAHNNPQASLSSHAWTSASLRLARRCSAGRPSRWRGTSSRRQRTTRSMPTSTRSCACWRTTSSRPPHSKCSSSASVVTGGWVSDMIAACSGPLGPAQICRKSSSSRRCFSSRALLCPPRSCPTTPRTNQPQGPRAQPPRPLRRRSALPLHQ